MAAAFGCASSRSAPSRDACMRTGGPVPFSVLFSDSAAAARLIEPLVREDTVPVGVYWGAEATEVFIDTAETGYHASRSDLERELARYVVPAKPAGDPMLVYRALAFRSNGTLVLTGRSYVSCAPSFIETQDLRNAMARARARLVTDAAAVIWIRVDPSGLPSEVRIHQSSGNERADLLIAEVGELTRFEPAMQDGRPSAVWIQLPVLLDDDAR